MVAARDADFTGEGGADQGSARPLTLAEQARLEEDARQRRLLENRKERLAGTTDRELGTGNTQRGAGFDAATGRYRTKEDLQQRPDGGSFVGSIYPTLKAISRDPVTAAVLAAPYGVVGAGAALGGFATGGVGTIAGGTVPAGVPAMGAPYAMASPFAGTGAAGVPAMGAPATVASPFGPGSLAAGKGGAAAAGAPAAGAGWTAKDTIQTASPLALWGLQTGAEALIRGGNSKEERLLREKQEQIARETQLRRAQQQQSRMDALGARMVAFDPYNQHLARMFGPEAAFQPEALAGMVENPMKPQLDPELQDYRGTDDGKERQIRDYMAARDKYNAAEEARRNRVMGGVQRPGPGPAPISMPAPQAARRF